VENGAVNGIYKNGVHDLLLVEYSIVCCHVIPAKAGIQLASIVEKLYLTVGQLGNKTIDGTLDSAENYLQIYGCPRNDMI